jgi:hypothetical protein
VKNEKMVLRGIFGQKRDEVTGNWRKLHNEEHHNLHVRQVYHCNDEVKENEMGRTCSTNREKSNAYRILMEESEGKRQLRRPMRRREHKIKTELGKSRIG